MEKARDDPRMEFGTSKFLHHNVQTCGYVFHDINGPNHGQTLKMPWYLLNEICMVLHWSDYCGRDSSKNLYQNFNGRKYQIGNACSLIENNDYFGQYVWMTSKRLERSRI